MKTSGCIRREISISSATSKNNVNASISIGARILDRQALACNVQFRTEGNKAVILAFDNRRQSLGTLHSSSLTEDVFKGSHL